MKENSAFTLAQRQHVSAWDKERDCTGRECVYLNRNVTVLEMLTARKIKSYIY